MATARPIQGSERFVDQQIHRTGKPAGKRLDAFQLVCGYGFQVC